MRAPAVLVLILALSASAVAQAGAAAKDGAKTQSGRSCRADDGQPARASACAKVKKRPAPVDSSRYFAHCRDVRTYVFTKCGGPYAEPVPTN